MKNNHIHIPIQNIYYMLAYAFKTLKQSPPEEIEKEDFENIYDIFAGILSKGIAQQLKQGLYRKYISENENLPVIKGKININETINNKLQRKNLISCDYDDLSENNIFNQILKTTAHILLRQKTVSTERKTALKKVILFFNEVDIIDPFTIKWNMLRFERSNQNYEMLLNISRFIIEKCLLSTEKGRYKMGMVSDKKVMSKLYENFVLAYYKYHHKALNPTAEQFKWHGDNNIDKSLLPAMITDITLKHGDKTLIIDTKYYSKILVINSQHKNNSNPKLRSTHLYQIFAYVKNKDIHSSGNIAGMLLYAKTDEDITPDCKFEMSGNEIYVKTLGLNTNFSNIATQLDKIVTEYFDTYKQEKV